MALLGILLVFVALILLQRRVYARYWTRNLAVSLEFSADTGVEGQSIELTEVITSRKILPLPWLTVKFQVSRYLGFPDGLHSAVTDDYYREDLFSLGMYQKISRTLKVDLKKRGYHTIKSIDLISSDLLLTCRYVEHAKSLSVLTVTPRMIARQDLETPYRQLVGTLLVRTALSPDPFEFRSIREYQGFDTMKSINWLATARTGQVKVNVKEFTASCEVRILLNVESDSEFADDQLLEEGIRIASSLCEYLVDDGISCGLFTNARDAVSGERVEIPSGRSLPHVQQVKEQLGRLDLARKPTDFANLLAEVCPDWSRAPLLVFISSNCSSRLSQSWTRCRGEGYEGIWILPEYDDIKGRTPAIDDSVFRWEVKRYGG